jgi:hypothetical protein
MNINLAVDDRPVSEALILAWADGQERESVMALARQERRQTMNLRTMPGAELVVLRRLNGKFAGWAGVDVGSDRAHPEVFSQFVYPQFRGMGLGALLEHFWWAYLDSKGCSVGFMRMELDSNETLVERRLSSGYCREISPEELGPRFVGACHRCELFGVACRRQIFLAVDVRNALAACRRSRGTFDIGSLPMRITIERKERVPVFIAGEAFARRNSQFLQASSPA